MAEVIQTNKKERAVLIGLVTKDQTLEQLNEYLAELEFLTTTAGAETISTFYQRLPHPDHRTYVGKGKLQEINQFVQDMQYYEGLKENK